MSIGSGLPDGPGSSASKTRGDANYHPFDAASPPQSHGGSGGHGNLDPLSESQFDDSDMNPHIHYRAYDSPYRSRASELDSALHPTSSSFLQSIVNFVATLFDHILLGPILFFTGLIYINLGNLSSARICGKTDIERREASKSIVILGNLGICGVVFWLCRSCGGSGQFLEESSVGGHQVRGGTSRNLSESISSLDRNSVDNFNLSDLEPAEQLLKKIMDNEAQNLKNAGNDSGASHPHLQTILLTAMRSYNRNYQKVVDEVKLLKGEIQDLEDHHDEVDKEAPSPRAESSESSGESGKGSSGNEEGSLSTSCNCAHKTEQIKRKWRNRENRWKSREKVYKDIIAEYEKNEGNAASSTAFADGSTSSSAAIAGGSQAAGAAGASDEALYSPAQLQAMIAKYRMQPQKVRTPLVTDIKVWAQEPLHPPTYDELFETVYNIPYSKKVDVFDTFPNPYNKVAHMNYPHSSIWLEGDKVMERVIEELKPNKIEFIVEAGSMHGGSAISMAMQLDKHGLKDVPILCIDPWNGDLNMWLNRVVWEHLDPRDGRATTFDQFMVNVKAARNEGKIGNHIVPFAVTSIIGARWLEATRFQPNLIYLDSAHEVDETYMELCLYWELLPVGGILMGDDYGWAAVRTDVDRFVANYGLRLQMFGVYYNWFIKKEA